MSIQKLHFKLTFHKGINPRISDKEFEEEFSRFFKSFCESKNTECSVSCVEVRKYKLDPLYEEEIYEIDYVLEYSDPNIRHEPDTLYAEICRKWCSDGKHNSHLQWLSPKGDKCFHRGNKQFHTDVRTSEFAFGTLPVMVKFIQKYYFREIASTSKRVAMQIMSSFFHSHRYFALYICINHYPNCKKVLRAYKFVIQYQSILRVLVNDVPGNGPTELFFHLDSPPFLYVEVKDLQASEDFSAKMQSVSEASHLTDPEKKWERSLKFGCKCSRSKYYINNVGKCPIFKIVLSDKYRARHIIGRLEQRCPSKTQFCYSPVQTVRLRNCLKDFNKTSLNISHSESSCERENLEEFKCQYAWEAMLNRSYEIYDQILLITQEQERNVRFDYWSFLKIQLQKYVKNNPTAFADALFHIIEMLSRGIIFQFQNAMKELFASFQHRPKEVDLPEGMCLARRIIITPSRQIFLPPMPHFDNRIIREYGSEYMLRLSFQDDNLSKLTYAIHFHSKRKKIIENIVGKVLKEGITVGHRYYEMLASSNSQLREHGMWMYANNDKRRTASYIRSWMGNFTHIKNVAKYMARMGQCFSTSEEAAQLAIDNSNEKTIKDIKTSDGRYTFSDGIGIISSQLAEEVRNAMEEHLKVSSSKPLYKPSAFQIRYRGCKGMLAEMPWISGRKLCIRPSMKKFECTTSNKLEIVKMSAPRALFLNRPLISILEQMHVPADVFIRLQKRMILNLTDSLLYETEAANILSNLLSLDFPFMELQKAGIPLTNEPFFKGLLLAVYKTAVGQLRSKTRIAIPPEYGRNMLGILDETKSLKYGQVFVQYSEELRNDNSALIVLKGDVIVTKNPSMHPGDVRKLVAVDVPALHHIKDCIVFPAHGNRPHADEMAGSDLDGDEYVVIWMKELIFPCENYEPMIYPQIEERNVTKNIGVPEMVQFFCDYILNDNIGSIASAHLAWADRHSKGIFSEVCLNIAKKYPYALDFAKTGETQYLKREEKVQQYPDFMEKGGINSSYRSKRVLGLLYRNTRDLEACVSKVNVSSEVKEIDRNLQYPGWEMYEESANKVKTEYSTRVTNILNKYGIQSETEALSGYVEKVNKYSQGRQEMANVLSIVKKYLIDTMNKFRVIFLNDVENEKLKNNLTNKEMLIRKCRRASAWYMVTYTQKPCQVISFPWIVSDMLIQVRLACLKSKNKKVENIRSSSLESADAAIKQQFASDFNCNLAAKYDFSSSFNSAFNTSSEKIKISRKPCPCILVSRVILYEWMTKSHLNLAFEDNACPECFRRIFDYFIETPNTRCCCGSYDSPCTCSVFCSPASIILNFFKFYTLSCLSPSFGSNCNGGCEGFRVLNLQSLALQTYANLAVSKNLKYFGVSFYEGLEDIGSSSSEDMSDETEGDPIRIPLKTDVLQSLIDEHSDEVEEILKQLSGVKSIFISGDKDKFNNWHMTVNSTGRNWQRWNLEELILDDRLTDILLKFLRKK